ncbi:MAG: hypothetical protein CMM32_10900 [Rhodospirillaceae bacterium]|nr:hypothetical protein [Rhodospirillaceae bacterium]|tara:strand:+ start:2494 stop:2844 length:351 start_codon:yes stop_codon:yes gene_type:complete
MTTVGKYLLLVSMDVDAEKEALFNEVYDKEHIPALLKVPGVVSVQRSKTTDLEMNIGGQTVQMDPKGEPRYTAIYEITDPQVLTSAAWDTAVEKGRWGIEVRPFTNNRRHTLKKLL